MIKLPNNNQWSQPNNSDLFGNIFISKNLNFDNEGYLTLSHRTRNMFDIDAFPDLSNASTDPLIAIINSGTGNGRKYFLGTKNIHYIDEDDFFTLVKDADTGVPTLATDGDTDGIIFNESLHVTNGTDVFNVGGGTWTKVYDTSNARFLCEFTNKNMLAVAKTNTVELINTSYALIITLTIPAQFKIRSTAWKNNRLYIGTSHNHGGEALLFEWDGATTSANNAYGVGASHIFSVIPYKNGVSLVTSEGQLLYCSGGISVLANFPIYYTNYKWLQPGDMNTTAMKVMHRGMVVEGDVIYIAVNAKLVTQTSDNTETNFDEKFPSGVWCFDAKIGLYLRWTIGGAQRLKTNAISTASVNTSTEVITVSGATVPATGSPLFYDDGNAGSETAIAGLVHRKRYFAIKVSSSTLKIASTYALALAGTAIDLTGTGNNFQYIVFDDNGDFGGIRNAPSAILLFTQDTGTLSSIKTDGTKLLIGGATTKTSKTFKTSIHQAVDGQENRGYAITPKVFSLNVQDQYQKIYVRHKDLLNPDDQIIVKYRSAEERLLPELNTNSVGGTWSDSNTFTSTEDLSSVAIGDEVEIVAGSGAGYTAHITAISVNGATYTVDLDETIQNIIATETFYFVVNNWTKARIITSSSNQQFTDIPVGSAKKWLQVKIELRGINTAIEDVQIINETQKPSV